jgi:hypothetical protein
LAVNLRISSLRKKSRKMNYPPSQTFNCGWDTLLAELDKHNSADSANIAVRKHIES